MITEAQKRANRKFKQKANLEKGDYYKKAQLRLKAWGKQNRKENPRRWMIMRAKCRAKKKGIDFDIVAEDIVIPTHCPILNIPLIVGGDSKSNSPSLDRIDVNKGYIKGNIRVISNKANACKSDLTLEEIKLLYLYSIGQI
jgi:hypothetical protein